jgi:hypothetical protein
MYRDYLHILINQYLLLNKQNVNLIRKHMYRTTYGTFCQFYIDYDPSYDSAQRARKNYAKNILAVVGRFHLHFHERKVLNSCAGIMMH